MLPLAVLRKASDELFNYNGSGMSIMEIHHNSPEFNEIITSLEASVRELLSVPQNYKVLFLRGGAVEQYAAIPLNLFSDRKCADYIIDIGPEGGDRGGNLVACGTPEEVAGCEASYTGQFLREKLAVNA